jgi:O-antigen biosynthesis protein
MALKIPMEKTAERYNPGDNFPSNAYEHWHRYLFTCQLVQGKKVLDIASGAGYGSHLLSQTAQSVTGVDISEEAVKNAREKYVLENLQYIVGNANHIPILGEQVFDVVVSFETIEHISESDQGSFVREVSRLLKCDGLFIVSTPNKTVYSNTNRSPNSYHLNELDRTEFVELLKDHFKFVKLLGQKILSCSYISDLSSPNETVRELLFDFDGTRLCSSNESLEPRYFLALCSNTELPDLDTSYFWDRNEALHQNIDELLQQSGELQYIKASRFWRIGFAIRKQLIKIFPHRGPG